MESLLRTRRRIVVPLLLAAFTGAGAGKEPVSAPDPGLPDMSDRSDMGRPAPEAGTAWAEAPDALKSAFASRYRTAGKKRPVFEEFLPSLGASAMLDFLEDTYPHCHPQAHDLGKALYAHVKDINEALRFCGNRCTNACMHGVIGEAFGGREFGRVAGEMASFCRKGEMARLHKPGNCAHGLGHALMILTDHDINRSLDGCERFEEPGLDYYCATGVFMEFENRTDEALAAGETPERPTPHFPCDVNPRFPAACYRYNLKYLSSALDYDLDALIDECLALPAANRAGCFHGLGNAHARYIARQPEAIRDICLHGSREDRTLCIEGVVEKTADYDEALAMKVCAALEAGEDRKTCEAAARQKMYRLDKPSMPLYRRAGEPPGPD